MSNQHQLNRYWSKAGQRGEAEFLLFGLAVLVTLLFSGTVWLLSSIRDAKDARVMAQKELRYAQRNKGPFVARADPAEYYVRCNGSLSSPLNVNYPCGVLPESYGELLIELDPID